MRDYLGWLEVRTLLHDQPIDPVRDQMLTAETDAARRKIPDAIRQAYSIVVTVNEANDVQAFKVAVSDQSLFVTIKADPRSRIQETAISAEAMLPDGPYDLWREDEPSRRVSDLVGAFAQFAKLPKMLRQKEILDTVALGILDGIWVARLRRPDGTARTFWRTSVDGEIMQDTALEVFLPDAIALSDIDPALLSFRRLPGLWDTDKVTVQDVTDYFTGGHSVTMPREGYDDFVSIPECEPTIVEQAIEDAVSLGLLWLTNAPASILGETVPPGILSSTATLRPPPEPISPRELTKEIIPGAWQDDRTNALAIMTELSHQRGQTLPWSTVRDAIEAGIQSRWVELSPDSGPWPCDFNAAQHVVIQMPNTRGGPPPPPPPGVLTAEATLEANGIQDLAEHIHEITLAAVGNNLRFNLRIELGGEIPPDPDVVSGINALLSEVSKDLLLH